MHEMSLARAIVEHAIGVIAAGKASRVVSVTLRLGLLSCADPESLRFCFPHVAEGTPLEGATINIVPEPLELFCEDCGQTTVTSILSLVCGSCQSDLVTVRTGQELVIQSLEVC